MKNILSEEFFETYQQTQTAPIDATPTGIATVDRIYRDAGGGRGLGRGAFVCIGANPGAGKSALALNFVSAALSHGESVGIISLEMSAAQLSTRLYALHSGTALRLLEHGGFTELAWSDTKRSLEGLPPLYVPDSILSTWESVVEYTKQCYAAGCRYVVLDYLQLVNTGDEDTIYRATQRVVTELRAFGADNGCTIICLSQFNRGTSSNYETPPRSQGLFGGMILEASADMCLLLDHSRYRRTDNTAQTFLLCTKNRHGPTCEIPVEWDYRTLRIREALEDEEQYWPK